MTHGRTIIHRGLILLLFLVSALAAPQNDPFDISSARTAAMGGRHAALADNLDTLFNNPAGFRVADPQFRIAEISLRLSGPIFDITSVAIEAGGTSSAEDLLTSSNVKDLLRGLYASMSLLGPLSFGYVGNGLGFGFFNTSGLTITSRGTVPRITASVRQSFLFAGGYAFRIPFPEGSKSTLDVGILLKTFVGGQLEIEKDALSLFGALDNAVSLIYNEPFILSLGAGADLGVLYGYGDRFAVGLVGRDLFTPRLLYTYSTLRDFLNSGTPSASSDTLPIDLTLGILYRPPLGRLGRLIDDLKLMLDYQDILDFLTHPRTATNPILHVGFGLEVILLEILSLRGGFYQGLFNAGLGFDLTIFKLNLAMFGTELSADPGLRSVFNILLGFEFTI